MALVTVNSTKYNVNGSLRDQYYNITGNSGDTLVIGITTVRQINANPSGTFSGITTAAGSNGLTTITFTTTGAVAFTAAQVQVLGN